MATKCGHEGTQKKLESFIQQDISVYDFDPEFLNRGKSKLTNIIFVMDPSMSIFKTFDT